MTEDEWFAIRQLSLHRAFRGVSPRLQRLLAVAACRSLGPGVAHPAAIGALEAAERFADTGKSKAALRQASQALAAAQRAQDARGSDPPSGSLPTPDLLALAAVRAAVSEEMAASAAIYAVHALSVGREVAERTARRWMWPAIRDIVGTPRPPVAFSPEWRTTTAVQLARGMYESRDFAAMPILADALQDAGCEDEQILAHCRDPHGVHARGCWVVDLVLGKA
jgi:hypothetical protein